MGFNQSKKAEVSINISCLRHLRTRRLRDHEPLISFRSHARAKVQSRITVPGETFNTSAVCSMSSPPKKTQFHNLTLSRIDSLQCLQRFIKRRHIRRLLLRQTSRFIERNLDQAAAALGSVSLARVVYQNPPHQPGSNTKKVVPILPSD